jgi:hypothetical protein
VPVPPEPKGRRGRALQMTDQMTDKPWWKQGPGQPCTRGPAFLRDLWEFAEKSRASYAAKENVPIEDVDDTMAIFNISDETLKRWPQRNGKPLSHKTLYARYSASKKLKEPFAKLDRLYGPVEY